MEIVGRVFTMFAGLVSIAWCFSVIKLIYRIFTGGEKIPVLKEIGILWIVVAILGMIGGRLTPSVPTEKQEEREIAQIERQQNKIEEKRKNEQKAEELNLPNGKVFLAEEKVDGKNVKIYFDSGSVQGNGSEVKALVGYDDDDIKRYRTVIGFAKQDNELYCMTHNLDTGAMTTPTIVKKGTKLYGMYEKLVEYVKK